MDASLLLFPITVPIGSFLVARASRTRAQRPVYLTALLGPPAVFLLILLVLPSGYPAPLGALEWIGIGLFVIIPAFVAWAALVSVGYAAGRMSID